jgi:hypothetical protein
MRSRAVFLLLRSLSTSTSPADLLSLAPAPAPSLPCHPLRTRRYALFLSRRPSSSYLLTYRVRLNAAAPSSSAPAIAPVRPSAVPDLYPHARRPSALQPRAQPGRVPPAAQLRAPPSGALDPGTAATGLAALRPADARGRLGGAWGCRCRCRCGRRRSRTRNWSRRSGSSRSRRDRRQARCEEWEWKC